MEKRCVLYDGKICDDCGECQRCDLDPDKICDNCMKCVNSGADYSAVSIDKIYAGNAENLSEDDLQ